ncbi:MAG: sugar-binding transcriptional regulator, partial [Acidobacteria bacterium]|nr:sugar-binding transcriptional regulator [Acidobacteriota bacterium]
MTSPVTDELELMVRVASLYYLEDIIQEDIAHSLGISRAKVGRLLKKAQQDGIVEITVNMPSALYLSLETELVQRFGLKQALLAPDVQDPDTQRSLVARSVANYLNRNLKDGDVVGVSMGR